MGEHEGEEEFGKRKIMRKHDPVVHRARTKRTRNDASSVSQLVQTVHHGKKTRRGLQNAQSE